MSGYKILVGNQAAKSITQLSADYFRQVKSHIDALASDPRPAGAKKLKEGNRLDYAFAPLSITLLRLQVKKIASGELNRRKKEEMLDDTTEPALENGPGDRFGNGDVVLRHVPGYPRARF